MRQFLNPLPLLADAGVPMIFFTLPAMLMLLAPIIVIEGLLCKKWLGLTTWDAMRSNAVSNLASMMVGVPVAWAIMLGVEFGTMGIVDQSQAIQNMHSPLANVVFFLLSAAWIGPPHGSVWTIPGAVLVLLVPFFLASYGTEYLIINHMLGMPEGDPSNRTSRRIRTVVRNANLVTYGMIMIATVAWLIGSLLRH